MPQQRAEKGVDDGRAKALELAHLRQDLTGEMDIEAGTRFRRISPARLS